MAGTSAPIPARFSAAIPYLNAKDGDAAIRFYEEAFGATIQARLPRPGGKLGHAELRIGEALFMLRDEYPEMNFLSPETVGGAPFNILVYVKDVEALVARARAAGATVVRPVEEQFHGDLMATVEDPFGYSWFFATHVDDLSPEVLEERSATYVPPS